jgi:hypothetical protein
VDNRALIAQLDDPSRAKWAQIVLERSFDRDTSGLSESLDKLVRRWRQQRLRELLSEIAEAQRRGDQARLVSLLEEKTSMSQSLHRGIRPGDSGRPG